MSDHLLAYLAEHPDGVTPGDVARDVLGVAGPAELLAHLARESLEKLEGAVRGDDGRYRLAASATHDVAVFLRTTGGYPPYDVLLDVGVAEIRDGGAGKAWSSFVQPDRPLSPAALESAGVDPRDLDAGRPLDEVLDRIAPLVDGARIVCFDSDRPAAFLRQLLRVRGRKESPEGALVLAPALRRAELMPRGGTIRQAALALRVTAPETGESAPLARAIAELFLAALDREVDFSERPPRPGFDYGKVGFGPELLEAIPERPGVYRFLDRDGEVLYVGKSKNLRLRVKSYLGHREKRRAKHAELIDRLWRVEWEETGSDLAAQFREATEIREKAPPINVQREVRERGVPEGDFALFLPAADEREIEVLLVRDGVPAGSAKVDRRGRGMREVRRALRAAFFDREPFEDDAGARILHTWLKLERDRQNLADLGQAGGIRDMARLVRAYVTDPELFVRKVFHR